MSCNAFVVSVREHCFICYMKVHGMEGGTDAREGGEGLVHLHAIHCVNEQCTLNQPNFAQSQLQLVEKGN